MPSSSPFEMLAALPDLSFLVFSLPSPHHVGLALASRLPLCQLCSLNLPSLWYPAPSLHAPCFAGSVHPTLPRPPLHGSQSTFPQLSHSALNLPLPFLEILSQPLKLPHILFNCLEKYRVQCNYCVPRT